jgi:transposase
MIPVPGEPIMSGNGQRKKWSPEEKLRIVLTGMQPGVEVADLCRREGLNPTMFYLWKKHLLGSAAEVFGSKAGRPSHEEERKAAEVRRLKDVIAEITAENLDLKTGLSD